MTKLDSMLPFYRASMPVRKHERIE